MRKVLKVATSMFLAICLLLSIPTISLAQASDIQGSWAEKQINDWVEKKLINGYEDGTFKPENQITRAEFAALVNRALGFYKKSDYKFSDVSPKDWFAGDISIGKAQGYLKGDGNNALPNKPINRQEVIAILARILTLEPDAAATSEYTDAGSIASWAKGSVGAVYKLGYINDYQDNTFKPLQNATRAEVVAILYAAVGTLYNSAGVYGPSDGTDEAQGNVTVTQPGITIKNLIIDGNLYLTEGIGEGKVTVENVTVKGTTTISGGGELELAGNFDRMDVNAKDSKITLDKSVTINKLTVNSPSRFTGDCTIETALINSNDVTIEAEPAEVIIAPGLTGVEVTARQSVVFGGGGGGWTPPSVVTVTGIKAFDDATAPSGADINEFLPTSAEVTLSNSATPQTFQVHWDTGSYQPGSSDGLYTFSGALVPPQGLNITVPSNMRASIRVIVGLSIISVDPITDINVSVDTALSSIPLPATAVVNLREGPPRTISVTSWTTTSDTPPYNGAVEGTYSFSGTLAVPGDVIDPAQHTASINVVVGVNTINVSSVDIFADKNVLEGTALSAINLPDQVTANLSNNSSILLNVDWDTSSYDGSEPGTYIIPGTISTTEGILNSLNVLASFHINVVNPIPDPVPNTPLQTSRGTLIDEYDSMSGWTCDTGNADISLDTGIRASGNASLNISATVPGGPLTNNGYSVMKVFNTVQDMSGMDNIQFDIYIPDVKQTDRVSIRFYTDDYSNMFNNCFRNLTGNRMLVNGWNRICLTKDQFGPSEVGSPSWDSISCMRVMVFPMNGCKPSVNLDRVAYNIRGRAQVLFTFDDGWYDLVDPAIANNAFSILSSRDFPATVWAKESSVEGYTGSNRTLNNGSYYLNETDLDRLYAAGWDIGNHTVNHPDSFDGMTDDQKRQQIRQEYEHCQQWLIDRSWERGAHFACYPSGIYDENIISILKDIGVLAARTTVYGMQTLPVDNLYKLKCIFIDSSNTVAMAEQQIDKAIATGSTIIFMLHKVEDSTDALSLSDFEELVQYVYSKGDSVDVTTMSGWYDSYMGNTRITSVNALTGISADYGTQASALGLPSTVSVNLNNGSTQQISVSWNTGNYNGNEPGTYTLHGALTLPVGVTNPDNLVAGITVTVEEAVIVISTTTAALHVTSGTDINLVPLPETVEVALSDGTTQQMEVLWNTSPYNPDVADTYTLQGTLELPEGVINQNDVMAIIDVIVEEDVT